MAVPKSAILEKYHQLCVEKALELGRVDFIVKGGLICETTLETFDLEGHLQFRFSPPTVRIATEHWEFAGELHLYEKELGVARGAFPWLEEVSDYICLATAGAPIKMEPFRDSLTEAHAFPPSHPREIWYNEIRIGRVVTKEMLSRANTFMHSAQHRISANRIKAYRRSLWWFRHGVNVEIESPLLAYVSFFNSLETLLRHETLNKAAVAPSRNNKTKEQFARIFGDKLGKELYRHCYGEKGKSLYDLRNDIDHGIIVELGSGILKVIERMTLLKAIVVDLALHWIGENNAVGGWLSQGVLEHNLEGLVILSATEARALGYQNSGPITYESSA